EVLVIVPWRRPLTYFTVYSARSFGFGVRPGRRGLSTHVKCSTPFSIFAIVISSRLPSGEPTNWIFISGVPAPVIPSHHAAVVVNFAKSAGLAFTWISHRPLKSLSAARAAGARATTPSNAAKA